MESSEFKSLPEKPEFLYHGSPKGDIKVFTPRVSLGTGEKYGAQVYASPDKAVASIFLADIGKSWSAGERNGVLYALIPLSREEFLERDKGGYLYKLPSETFSADQERGLGEKEWASSEPVEPAEKIKIDSALDEMINNGVQVYFVTDEQYEQIQSSNEPNLDLLKTVESENQRRGVNVREF
jgi:hypothetical protein